MSPALSLSPGCRGLVAEPFPKPFHSGFSGRGGTKGSAPKPKVWKCFHSPAQPKPHWHPKMPPPPPGQHREPLTIPWVPLGAPWVPQPGFQPQPQHSISFPEVSKPHVPPQLLHGLNPGFTEAAESGSFLSYLGLKSPRGLPTRPCFLSLGGDYFFLRKPSKKSRFYKVKFKLKSLWQQHLSWERSKTLQLHCQHEEIFHQRIDCNIVV